MKTKEFNLSKFRVDDLRGGGQLGYREEDVKEFIKIIQDECSLSIEQRRILQNRAGKDLI